MQPMRCFLFGIHTKCTFSTDMFFTLKITSKWWTVKKESFYIIQQLKKKKKSEWLTRQMFFLITRQITCLFKIRQNFTSNPIVVLELMARPGFFPNCIFIWALNVLSEYFFCNNKIKSKINQFLCYRKFFEELKNVNMTNSGSFKCSTYISKVNLN